MIKKESGMIFSFYTVSPMHAGSGASVAAVDLPIQRERHTGWPHVQASSMKGALRSHFRNFCAGDEKDSRYLLNIIFGSDEQDSWEKFDEDKTALPGAISVTDGKLFSFPVRSDIAPFISVTSPQVLKRLTSDMQMTGISFSLKIPEVLKDKAVSVNCATLKNKIILEDAVVEITSNIEDSSIKNLFPDVEKLIIISDEMFDYCVTSCTEIQTNIKIDSRTGSAEEGGLRYQELLPADSALYSIIHFSPQIHKNNKYESLTIKNHIIDTIKNFVQIGGEETLGRGICKVYWHKNEGASK